MVVCGCSRWLLYVVGLCCGCMLLLCDGDVVDVVVAGVRPVFYANACGVRGVCFLLWIMSDMTACYIRMMRLMFLCVADVAGVDVDVVPADPGFTPTCVVYAVYVVAV